MEAITVQRGVSFDCIILLHKAAKGQSGVHRGEMNPAYPVSKYGSLILKNDGNPAYPVSIYGSLILRNDVWCIFT